MKRSIFIACVAGSLIGIAVAQSASEDAYRKPQVVLPSRFAGSEKLIVGGAAKVAKPGEIPWQASVQITRGGSTFQCGGSVIKPGWVLTAAHCVEVHPPTGSPPPKPPLVGIGQIDVRTGSVNVDHGGLEAQPVKMFLMREARDAGARNYDVALLKVATHEDADPIALEQPAGGDVPDSLAAGAALVVSGFGATDKGTLSPRLLHVGVGYIRRQTCNSEPHYNGRIDATMICAGDDKGNDSCGGDSGGPLFSPASAGQAARLIGVVSWGPSDCGNSRYPGVYARVANREIATWIRDTLAAN